MSDDTTANTQMLAQMQDDLQELARLLRETRHLEPQAQCELASLLEELGSELNPGEFNSTHITHLAETVSRLARSLHEQQHSGLLTAARDRLQKAAIAAEVEAPVATGIVRRFIDVLGSIGI